MLPITELSALSLSWQQPSAWRREYLLISDSGTHGQLVFPSVWKQIVEAECGGEGFSFQRTGFFKRQVWITRRGEKEAFAAYYPNAWGSGGVVELGGAIYNFRGNFWQTRYEFTAPDGEVVLAFSKRGLFRTTVDVEVHPEAFQLAELSLLVTLGMVAILLHHQDAAAAAAATSAS
jgi:hypothetical protein